MKTPCPDRLSRAFAAVIGATSCVAQAAIPSGYSVTPVNTIGGLSSFAQAINDQGWVTGAMEFAQGPGGSSGRAFLYAGATIDLGTLPGDNASAGRSVNNAGVVVGDSFVRSPIGPSFSNRAFRYNGAYTDFGTSAFYRTDPADINNLGQIVGGYYPTSSEFPTRPHAFLHTAGVTTDLGTLGGSYSLARRINDSGQVVGRSYLAGDLANRGFTYANGVMTALGTLGGTDSQAESINNAGHIVGTSDVAGSERTHAFLYVDGVMTDLGSIGALAGADSYAIDINDAGDVIGYADNFSGARRYFIYADGVVRDIGSLLGADSGWTITDIAGINAYGQIAVTAFKQGYGTQALRLDPIMAVPEPATYVAFGAGLMMIAMRWRRTAKRPD